MASIRCWYSSTSGSASSSPSAGGSPAGGSAGAPSPSPPSSPSSPSPPSGCGFGSSYSSGNDPSRRSRNIPPGLDVTSGTRSTASGASPASSSSPIASSNVHPGGARGARGDEETTRPRYGAGAPRVPVSGLRASSTPCARPGALVRVETRVSRSESRRRPASAKTGTKKLAGDERRGLEMTLWPISSALRRRTPGSDAGVSKMNSAGFQICTERASDGGPVCDVAGARAPSRARPPPFFARDPIRDRADAAP